MNYDINPTVGGPLSRDKVWFYGAARWTKTQNYVGGMFHNVNEGDREHLDSTRPTSTAPRSSTPSSEASTCG